MNIENINSAIAIMTRHMEDQLPLNMEIWQMDNDRGEYVTEEKHLCGTPCCFAGYIAVSPEFQADGGEAGMCGAPELGNIYDEHAIREWLGCSTVHAEAVCSNNDRAYPEIGIRLTEFADVIAALVSLRDYGMLPGELLEG